MQPDPKVYSDWHHAKKEAGKVASILKPPAVVLQLPDGRKRILFSGKVIDCTTWLSCYCYLYQIYTDQQKKNTHIVPTAKLWIGGLPGIPPMALSCDD